MKVYVNIKTRSAGSSKIRSIKWGIYTNAKLDS